MRGDWGRAVLVAAGLLVQGAALGADNDLETQVARLVAAARAAAAPDDAESKLKQAEKLLAERGRDVDALTRGFLGADVLRARGRIAATAWQRKGEDLILRQTAWRNLLAAVREYTRLVKVCEGHLDTLEASLGHVDPSDNVKWQRLRGLISRANYSEAWTRYNLGLVASDEDRRKESFEEAVERFSSFTARGYRKHAIVADCFLGQALCHYELGQHFKVLELLKPARRENTPAGVFRRMTFVLIQSARAYGSYLAAEDAAKRYFDGLPASHKLDATELAMALERARALSVLADPKQNPEFHKLFQGRLDAVAKTVYAYGEPWRGRLGRILGQHGEGSPLKSLSAARALFEQEKFAEALTEADSGLRLAESGADLAVAADLRYARAAALVNLGRPQEAFRAIAEFLRAHPSDRRTAELAGRAVPAGRQAIKADPPLPKTEFLEFLDWFEKQFPSRPEIEQLPWDRAKVLLALGRFAEAERVLAPVKAGSKMYVLAQYGLAVAAAKRVEKLLDAPAADPNAVGGLLDRSAAAVGRLVGASAGRTLTKPEQQAVDAIADVAAATAERYLTPPAPNPAGAIALLDRIESLGKGDAAAARRHRALRVRALVRQGKIEEASQLLEGLLKAPEAGAADAVTFSAILAPLISAFDGLAASGKADAAERLGEQIVRMQRALVSHVESSSAPSVREQGVSAVMALAETLRKLGRPAEAAGEYRKVVDRLPRARAGEAIRGLALCLEESKRYATAAEQWSLLANGLKKRSQPWYEARYHWIWCLYRQGRWERARKLLTYFRLQNPKIEIDKWRMAFDALAAEIGPSATAPATRPEPK